MIAMKVPSLVSASGSTIRNFMREYVPGLEQFENPVTQQINDNKPSFAMSASQYELAAWSDAIADAAHLRLSWPLAEPSESAYQRLVLAVERGAKGFPVQNRIETGVGSRFSRALCRNFIDQIRDVPMFTELADRGRDIQGSLRDEDILNRRLLCAAALANLASTSAKSTRQYKRSLAVSSSNQFEALHEFVPAAAVQILGNYVMLAEDEIVYREMHPRAGRIFADLRDGTTSTDTCVVHYDSTFPVQRPWLVANGTLLDITTTRRTKPSLHKSLRTLAGFVLADMTDEHGIRNVAWYHASSGQLYEKQAAEFFDDLGATKEIAELRKQFATTCQL